MRNPSIACKSCFRNVASPVSDKTPRRFGKQVKTEKFPVSASLQRIVAVLHLRQGKHHGSRGDSIPTPFVSQFRVPCQCEQDQMVRQTRDKKIPGHIADAAHQDAFCPKAQCSGVLKIERQKDLPGIFRDDFCRNGSVTVNGRTFSLPLAKNNGEGGLFRSAGDSSSAGNPSGKKTIVVSIPDKEGLIASTALYNWYLRLNGTSLLCGLLDCFWKIACVFSEPLSFRKVFMTGIRWITSMPRSRKITPRDKVAMSAGDNSVRGAGLPQLSSGRHAEDGGRFPVRFVSQSERR